MKKFNIPEMQVQKLDVEEIMGGSSDIQTGCVECYCGIVVCDPWNCIGLVCNGLDCGALQ